MTFTAGIGSVVWYAFGALGETAPNPAASLKPTEFGLIKEAWDTLHQQFVGRDTLDDRAFIYGAIEGLTQAVGDTGHTDFMTPEERKERNDALSGSYVGIGVWIEPDDAGLPRVIGVFDGGPAEAAGIAPGDVIVAVDGRSTEGRSIDEVAGWVRGEAGTNVELTIRPGTGAAERTISMVRADVPIHSVSWTMVPGTTTGLIRLDQFSNGAADDVVEALKAARAAGATRIVLDLRGNPGGYVNEAVGVASQFLAKGLVYIERNASDERTEHPVSPMAWRPTCRSWWLSMATPRARRRSCPARSRNAARAKVVGETTFGTGTVLGEFDLSDGSALRVGTVEWLDPSGRRIGTRASPLMYRSHSPTGSYCSASDDVAKLTAVTVGSIDDTQLAKALEVVATEQVATTP